MVFLFYLEFTIATFLFASFCAYLSIIHLQILPQVSKFPLGSFKHVTYTYSVHLMGDISFWLHQCGLGSSKAILPAGSFLTTNLRLDSCSWSLLVASLVHLLVEHILNSILKKYVCGKQILQSLGLKISLFWIINHFPSGHVRYCYWLFTSNIIFEK